jgi:thiol peroxidase
MCDVMYDERTDVITFDGNPLTLVGDEVQVGQKAPNFEILANDLSPVKLSDSAGKVRILSVVPSLDTPVCDTQTRKFNEHAAALGEDVEIITISADLPFAQSRWCGAAGVDQVTTLSDHREVSFGTGYGLLIKELRLLTRALLVIDREGIIQYIQIVGELTNEPNYDEALEAARKLA